MKLIKITPLCFQLDKEIRIKKKKKYNQDELARMNGDESLRDIDEYGFLRGDDGVLVTVKNQNWLLNYMKKHGFTGCDYDCKPYGCIKFYK